MNLLNLFFLAPSVTLGSNEAPAAAEAAQVATQAVTQAAQQTSAGAGFGTIGMILYILGLVALFYFFAIRPQKKREKELQTMQSNIKLGDWVLTSSGMYGKVVDITDQVFIVEFGTNKSVCIPVRKSEIMGNKEPNLTNKPSDNEDDK